MQKLFKIYKRLLEIHIATKAKDVVFHEATAKAYDQAFSAFHSLSEKYYDLEEDILGVGDDCEAMKKEAYELVENLKEELEGMKDTVSTGFDDEVRGLINSTESICGMLRGFVKEEEEEVEDKKEEPKISMKKGLSPIK